MVGARFQRNLGTFLLIAPAVLLIVLWFVVPLARFLALAFTGDDGPFAALRTLLESAVYRRVFLNTFALASVVTAIALALAFPLALALSRLRGFGFNLLLFGVLFPFWISLLVRTFSWMLLLENSGPINRFLVRVGVAEKPLSLLFTDTGVVIGMVHVLLPYAVFPLLARMRGIDDRLILASDGLGASRLSTIRLVYLPLLTPGLFASIALVFLLALGFFITPALLGGAKTLTIATLIAGFVTDRLAWSLAAAASLILLVAVGVLLAAVRHVLPVGEALPS
jgi:putative spermidine/putrescine transport system permease protein